jgi:DNA-binding PadR family transcriptional regulator
MALTSVETLILAALSNLGDDAYGVSVHDAIEQMAARPFSIAGVYSALDRMERAGLVRTFLSAPRAERGGRARRHYALTAAGRRQAARERDLAARIWSGAVAPASGRRR